MLLHDTPQCRPSFCNLCMPVLCEPLAIAALGPSIEVLRSRMPYSLAGSVVYEIGALLLFTVALLVKESAASFPLLLVGTTVLVTFQRVPGELR